MRKIPCLLAAILLMHACAYVALLAQSTTVTVVRGVSQYAFDYSPADVTTFGVDSVTACLDGLVTGCPTFPMPSGTVEATTPAGLQTYRVTTPATTPLGVHTVRLKVCNTAQSRCSVLGESFSINVQDPPIPAPQNSRIGS